MSLRRDQRFNFPVEREVFDVTILSKLLDGFHGQLKSEGSQIRKLMMDFDREILNRTLQIIFAARVTKLENHANTLIAGVASISDV
jgi:hypothetical protein